MSPNRTRESSLVFRRLFALDLWYRKTYPFRLRVHEMKSGKMILLNGTSSAGKSTITDALHALRPDFEPFKIDDWFTTAYVADRARTLGWDGAGSAWLYLVSYVEKQKGEPPFDTETRAYLFQETSPMYVAARKALQAGRNAIVDMVFEYDPEYQKCIEFFADVDVLKVLVYCPLDVLIDRVARRNRAGVAEEMRTVFLSFEQFVSMYRVARNGDVIVDSVTTESLREALEKAVEQLVGQRIPERYMPRLEKFRRDFVKHFELDRHDRITLTPCHEYDLVVNTGSQTPEEIAKKILGACPPEKGTNGTNTRN